MSSFARAYTVRHLIERRGWASDEYFFGTGSKRKDGLLLRVECASDTWDGIFEFGDTSFSAVISHPNPYTLVVVSRGNAFSVDVRTPNRFDVLTRSATGAFEDVRHNLLLLHSQVYVIAIEKDGLAWRAEIPRGDGILTLGSTQHAIVGTTEIAGLEGAHSFQIDPANGEITVPALL